MFWIADPVRILFDPASATDFLPVWGADARTADGDSQLNSLMRLAVYFAIAMLLLGRSSAAVFSLLLGSLFTYGVYQSRADVVKARRQEEFGGASSSCRRPTQANPFMNPMPFDAKADADKSACDIEDPLVRREMNKHFDKNLFRDVSDVFQSQASDRQYYTMPVTKVVNDAPEFARWLYDVGPTCKEDQRRCRG